MSLFDQRDMAAITSPDFPGERLIVWRREARKTMAQGSIFARVVRHRPLADPRQ
jgi:hypothetical protein